MAAPIRKGIAEINEKFEKFDLPTDQFSLTTRGMTNSKIDELMPPRSSGQRTDVSQNSANKKLLNPKVSLFQYLRSELNRNYLLENDEARYSERREKVYTCIKIPINVEKFMTYGFLQCLDSFLFVFTFLPLRLIMTLWVLLTRPCRSLFWQKPKPCRLLQPAEICDMLKAVTFFICAFLVTYIDTSMLYHLIKSQSVIKLYIFFNMLEVGDRLFSAFGQDLLDTLFWTATEPRERKREHFGVIPHLLLVIFFVFLHTVLVLCQATTLNVAINSSNKALLTIMMSNNFVELKGSVFKKFEKNNLFQMSCSDVRERFHYVLLLITVVIQTMKEYSWKEDRFWILLPDCLMVLGSEVVVDWVKHAFITRFNEIPNEVYQNYTTSLAYDLASSKNRNAFSDHSDLVSRRMGFIPLPLGLLFYRIATQALAVTSAAGILLILLGYVCMISLKLLNSLVMLGVACDLIEQHEREKEAGGDKKGRARPGDPAHHQRCSSQPPSRKHSTAKMGPTATSSAAFTGSLPDVSLPPKNPHPLGPPAPLFANSTVSLNSLGMNDDGAMGSAGGEGAASFVGNSTDVDRRTLRGPVGCLAEFNGR